MKNTVQISIKIDNENCKDELIAKMSVLNYDAFEEKQNELNAYIEEEAFDVEALENILDHYKLSYTKAIIEDQNWNALWESNFEPVIVDDFCAIRAEFHQPFLHKKYEIIITPKMSFGTCHHATTYLMVSEMRHIDFAGKQVADFGTGTGILSILADKMGSKLVMAIDNDAWSMENSKENIEKNGCRNIIVKKAEGFITKQKFDIILANINRNVILENINHLSSTLKSKAKLLISGLLKNDESEMIFAFANKGFNHISTAERNGWICILFQKKEIIHFDNSK